MQGKLALVLLALGAASVLGKPKLPEMDVRHAKIVGGGPAVPHEFPWMLDMRQGGHYCGASIVNSEWAVTAAHCSTSSPSAYTLVAGDHNIGVSEGGEQSRQVVRIIRHPGYQAPGTAQYENDIALMQVSPPWELNENISAAILPDLGFPPPSTAVVSGWGALSQGGGSPTILQKVTVPVVSDDDCRAAYGQNAITDSMICSGEAGKDSCQGDSGGPKMCIVDGVNHLCGIVSWGRGCAQAGFPGVYTEVSYFTEWIQESIVPPVEDNSTFVVQDSGCGGVLVGSSGRISYHLDEDVPQGQRCSWTVRTDDRDGIRIEDLVSGLGPDDSLTVTEINNERGEVGRTTVLNAESSPQNFAGPLIVITLSTSSDSAGSGFSLVFQGTGYPGTTGLRFTHLHLDDDTGSLSYPVGGGNYQADELATIAINPPNAQVVTLRVDSLDLESSGTCGFDSLTIQTHSSSGYSIVSRICGNTPPPAAIVGNDGLVLLTFRTDFSIQYSGFVVSWSSV